MTVVSYTSWWQIQNLSWLRELIYLDDSKDSPCKEQHQGYGRLYQHGCFVNPVSVVQSSGKIIDRVHQGFELAEDEEPPLSA